MATIEEKAKAYDEALEKAKGLYNCYAPFEQRVWLEDIFPELKESEDERIRKELIAFLKENHETGRADETWSLSAIERWIAWLEKQGSQNPAWSEEDEANLQFAIDDFQFCVDNNQFPVVYNTEKHKEVLASLKSLKDRVQPQSKQEWSEEDEEILGKCIDAASGYYSPEDKQSMKDWLRAIKDRVQPKQEWNEEDEQYLLVCKNALAKYQTTNKWDADIISHWLEDKFKSLKPQNTWKPSDEQMTQLSKYCPDNRPLTSLYNDLNKLKG